MTPKQLERKAKQLYFRKRLIETVVELEENIKILMVAQSKQEIETSQFIIRLIDGNLEISLRPNINPNQLRFNFEGQLTS